MKGSTLSSLVDAREQGEAVVLATDLETGREQLIRPFQIPEGDGDPLERAAREAAIADRSRTFEAD